MLLVKIGLDLKEEFRLLVKNLIMFLIYPILLKPFFIRIQQQRQDARSMDYPVAFKGQQSLETKYVAILKGIFSLKELFRHCRPGERREELIQM